MGGVILLEPVLLKGKVAKKFCVLFDVLWYFLNELAALPQVVLKGGALAEVVADDVEGANGP